MPSNVRVEQDGAAEWLDDDPQVGDTAIITNHPQILLYVVTEHLLPAGEIVKQGETVAEQLDVAPDRDVVLCVKFADLEASPREFESHEDILDAIDEAAIIPEPYPTSLIAPLPQRLRETLAGGADVD